MVLKNDKFLKYWLLGVFVLIFTLIWFDSSFAQHRVMPLGNSITLGIGSGSPYKGFRKDLYNLLVNNGMNYDFVGSQQDGTISQFDIDHEGHAGWKIQQIDANVNSWLQDSAPTIVLLHIGTNDISSGESNQTNINEIESIVNKIYQYDSDIAILLCSIIPRKDCDNSKCTKTEELNTLIQQLISQKANSGYNIYHVNQYSAFTSNSNWQSDYMSDTMHPNTSGYNVMALTYFNILKNIDLPAPEYTLNIVVSPEGAGTVDKYPDKEKYYYDENVRLTANPASGFRFNFWDGIGGDIYRNPTNILMKRNRTITVYFEGEESEYVSIPSVPTGPSNAEIGLNLTFYTGGSTSSLGNEVEYQFDWGDGEQSSWGGATRSHSYSSSGTYLVKAHARSKPNPDIISNWSGTHSVSISGALTYTLAISTDPISVGSVIKSPDKSQYNKNESVQLTAQADNTNGASGSIYIEAETGIISGPVTTGYDSEASGGHYVYGTSSQPKAANIEYSFEIQESGSYTIWGRCYALSGGEDSFFIVVDGNSDTLTWHLDTNYNDWIWQKVSDWNVVKQFSLNAGHHSLSVVTRDINSRIDKIIITKENDFYPTGKGEDPTTKIYRFDHWTGDLTGSNNPATIVMNNNKSVIAHFVETIEVVSDPTTPSGPSAGFINNSLIFTTGGAASTLGHEVEYQFDWGDGNLSNWGASTQSYIYTNLGSFQVRSRARCKVHTQTISNWSNGYNVTISEKTLNTLTINVSPEGAGSVERTPYKNGYDENEWVQLTAKSYSPDDNIRIEAESGIIEGPISIGSDIESSGGNYIYGTTSDPRIGSIEYQFNIAEAGTYTIWGRCYALSNVEDSFFIQVDGSNELTWHLDTDYNKWIWQKVSDQHIIQSFSLTAGQHTLKVIKRDINARLDKIIVTKDPNFVPTGMEEEMVMDIKIEAENGMLSGPVAIGNDGDASGEQYVYGTTSEPQVGDIEYEFNIKKAGTYVIWGRCYALSGGEDSFFIQLDGMNILTWHLDTDYYNWIWQKVSDQNVIQSFSLAAGQHTLKVIKRDINARLDKIVITNSLNFVPSGKEEGGASPEVSYQFDHWDGDLTGNVNPVDVLMSSNKTITAYFVEADEIVSSPTILSGPNEGFIGQSLIYMADGAVSSNGNNVEYQFDWGDGSLSNWGSGTKDHFYTASNDYTVKARARSHVDSMAVSSWSAGFAVSISNVILSISVDPQEAGTVSKNPDKPYYSYGDTITLIPSAVDGYSFDHWSGDLTGEANPIKIAMNNNKTVTAIFAEAPEVVHKPTTISGPSSGIMGKDLTFVTGGAVSNLGNEVEYQFDWGDGIFSEWGSSTSTHKYYSTGTMEVKSRARSKVHTNVVSDWTNTHIIVISGYSLDIVVNPDSVGNVIQNPSKPLYANNWSVELQAVAISGYVFDHWSGDLSGNDNPITIIMNGNKQVVAHFLVTQEFVSAPTIMTGSDSGIVNESLTFSTSGSVNNFSNGVEYQFDWGDGTLSDWGDSTRQYSYSTVGVKNVKSRARSKVNSSVVSQWSEVHSLVIYSVNYTITINIEPIGTGSVNRTPLKSEYEDGDTVILTPIPVTGYMFDYWSGDLIGPANPGLLTIHKSKIITANFRLISNVKSEKIELPEQFSLSQNYPNPFNPETTIQYQLPKICDVKLSIYNVNGEMIKKLVDETQNAGYYYTNWHGTDKSGNKVPSGVYLYLLETEYFSQSRKMILIK